MADSYYIKSDCDGVMLRSGCHIKICKDYAKRAMTEASALALATANAKVRLALKWRRRVGFWSITPPPSY